MPASTSETAARLLSTSAVSVCSERMVAFIGFPCFALSECPPHDE
jgi:hypothetical protein